MSLTLERTVATVSPNGRRSSAGPYGHRPPAMTVPEMLRHSVAHQGYKAAFLRKVGDEWEALSYVELADRVRALALGLLDLGVERGDRVALLSENRPEWAITDLALLTLGAVNVPLYVTLPPSQVRYIVQDSGAKVLIVSNARQLAKAQEVRSQCPALEQVVMIDPGKEPAPDVLALADVYDLAAKRAPAEAEERAARVRPEDHATIIYTSGTTGDPKGAVLTHDNFMSNAQSLAGMVEILPDDLFLSFLPLSHVFERMAGHYLPLYAGATVAYAESVFTVQTNMQEMRPTVMASVPRLYEALHSRTLDALAKQPACSRRLAEWALEAGRRYQFPRIAGEPIPLAARLLYPIADALVLQRMRTRLTGGRLRFFISGGAPLPVETARFLTAAGLHILEGYGLTETSPVICVNLPQKTKIGTVGPPIPGVEVRIADDGEILSRGPHIMVGYHNKPEATAQAIDADGWFHTGDIGMLEADGYLRITDRKKDILVLANGKNVAPQPIEGKLKASPFIANVVLFGDREPQVVALIVPDFEHLKRWAREQGIDTRDTAELIARPEVKRLYREEIDRVSPDLADFEMIRRFTLLARDFSQEQDELTPTLKVKRRVVAEHFAAEIAALYGGAPPA
jgi:long-chain acyl-CoA synthetase